jgi:uncharacterized protein with FMN-binding domain
MQRVTLWLGGTGVGVALLFSYRTSTEGPVRATAARAPAGIVAAAPVAPVPAPVAGRPASPTTAPARVAGAPLVVNGTSVDTQYGPVQVQVTIAGGRITRAAAIDHPTGGQSDDINAAAVPQLNQETLAAQNAHIDAVSGATYTSQGYTQSLQAALDAAHLKS